MKKSSTIRELENRALKGDVKANYQLYEVYRDGSSIDEDQELSSRFYDTAIEQFSNTNLSIQKLKLASYRGFSNLEINFPKAFGKNASKLTVIVGVNGTGKTTVLEAISNSLKFLARRIENPVANTQNLMDELDINVKSELGAADLFFNFEVLKGVKYSLSLSKSKPLGVKKKGDLVDFRQLAELFRMSFSRNEERSLPIMAFYSVKRSNDIVKRDLYFDQDEKEFSYNIFDGYKDAFDGYANFKYLFSWLRALDDIANAEEVSSAGIQSNIDRINEELNSPFANKLRQDAESNVAMAELLNSYLLEKEKELETLQGKLLANGEPLERKLINLIKLSISQFMEGFDNLRIQRKPSLDLLVDKGGITLSVLQLSQGEKSLMALVADITRRLIILNPKSKSPLNGKGIVLIDEIDLHLHPSWQQMVIPRFLSTFPNIQFIMTTHSPQVLTTVKSENIRILDDGKVFSAPIGCRGAESSALLNKIFEVSSRPPNEIETIKLTEYKNYVYKGMYDDAKAIKLRSDLNSAFGGEELELNKLDLYIANDKWEKEFEKN